MKKQIIYVLGLSRVGSTMLDLVLGNHPQFIGLGEIFQVIRPDIECVDSNSYCSCGEIYHRCPFWSTAIEELNKNPRASLNEKYRHIIHQFDRHYGSDYVMVDSSKTLNFLNSIQKLNEADIKVIYLIRDVRAWTISRLTKRKKRPNYYVRNGAYAKRLTYQYGSLVRPLAWLLPYLTRLPSYYFLIWYMQNRSIAQHLKKHQINHFKLGYDELALNPEVMMPEIFRFLGIESETSDFSSLSSASHVLIGNTRKTDPKRRAGIFYDNRWMYRNEWLRAAALLPNVMHYNAVNVYNNMKQNSIWAK